jgi:probable rRNA maturation factor
LLVRPRNPAQATLGPGGNQAPGSPVTANSVPNATRGSIRQSADRQSVDRTQAIYRRPWRVDIANRSGVRTPLPSAAIARAVSRALDAASAPEPGSVTVVLTDDAELAELNLEHMDIAGPTDVLSFPMLEPSVFGHGEASRAMARIAETGSGLTEGRRIHIGDIAISVERAIDQADAGRGGQTGDIRWSAADELRLLVTHGTLHLCGWDHAEPEERAAMRTLEQRLLAPMPPRRRSVA